MCSAPLSIVSTWILHGVRHEELVNRCPGGGGRGRELVLLAQGGREHYSHSYSQIPLRHYQPVSNDDPNPSHSPEKVLEKVKFL